MTIARYVQGAYAKPAYAVESFDVRAWPGLAMVVDALQRAGHEVDYCGEVTAHRHRIILVSITSACDWWSFIAERERWQPGAYTVIVGGPGCLNVRPFLRWFDVAVFGRAEEIIAPLVRETLAGHRLDHPSVCYSAGFSPDREYRVAQASVPWPHSVRLESGKMWTERAIGCQRKCLFCAYTWHRRHVGGDQAASGAADAMWGAADDERTMFDLDMEHPESWPAVRLIGLDGMSARLRQQVAKPIDRARLRGFFGGLLRSPQKPQEIKVYNIVGYPGETRDDWWEFTEDLRSADDTGRRADKQWKLVLHCTPFRAMPATPAACWPMSRLEHRGQIAATLKSASNPGLVFYQGARFWALESMGTDSLATVALDAVVLRGTEADSENVGKIARTRRFWSANSGDKLATLARCFDLDGLFGEFTAETLPTRYLRTYAHVERQWGRRPWVAA